MTPGSVTLRAGRATVCASVTPPSDASRQPTPRFVTRGVIRLLSRGAAVLRRVERVEDLRAHLEARAESEPPRDRRIELRRPRRILRPVPLRALGECWKS